MGAMNHEQPRYLARQQVYGWGVYDRELARWVRFRLSRERAHQLAVTLNERRLVLRAQVKR